MQLMFRFILTLLCWIWATPVSAAEQPTTEPLRIAVAANFHGTLQQLISRYQQQQSQTFLLSAGSSGALYTQIRQDAPFHLFFSADSERPASLEQAGLTRSGSRFTYAEGVLVLWSADPTLIDARASILFSQHFRHLSMAEPRHAPYGLSAQQVLTALELWQPLAQQQKLVRAQSIAQAYGQIASGAATLGFVALAQLKDSAGQISGSYWLPPAELYQPIIQQAVILNRAAADPQLLAAAQHFVTWLQSVEAVAIIEAAGYRVTKTAH